MNKVSITISVFKNDDMFFFHHHSFSNLNIEFKEDKSLVLEYLRKLDALINPTHSFISVFEVLISTAFSDGTASITFKNFKRDKFVVNVGIITE